MGISSPAGSRLVLKQNTAGQVLLPVAGSPATPSTDSIGSSFGGWAQVTSSTSVEYYVVGVMAYCTAGNNAAVSAPLYVDIGMGASGSEVSMSVAAIGSSIGTFGSTTPNMLPGGHILLHAPVRVAAASRLAVRTALAATGGNPRACNVHLFVVPFAAVEGN